jgi:hypothetical protein
MSNQSKISKNLLDDIKKFIIKFNCLKVLENFIIKIFLKDFYLNTSNKLIKNSNICAYIYIYIYICIHIHVIYTKVNFEHFSFLIFHSFAI